LSENRVSFTNENLNGYAGYLVEFLGDSDNGEQNELDGIDTNDIRMQFYIPSHHFDDSYAIGVEKSPELVVPFQRPGSLNLKALGKEGLGFLLWVVNFLLKGRGVLNYWLLGKEAPIKGRGFQPKLKGIGKALRGIYWGYNPKFSRVGPRKEGNPGEGG